MARSYVDRYGNVCTLVRAWAGRLVVSADFVISDSAGRTTLTRLPCSTKSPTCPTTC
ncbi:MAG: hypothetical protein WDN04_19275 [Rhodospirillales bacterium]